MSGLTETIEVRIFEVGRETSGKAGKDLIHLSAAKTAERKPLFSLIFQHPGTADREAA